jgi:hypothetical protein
VPLTEAESKYASLVKEQMDALIEATFMQHKADQLHTMVQTLLINKVRENSANPDASSDEEPSLEMTDEERFEELSKYMQKLKSWRRIPKVYRVFFCYICSHYGSEDTQES